MAGFAPACQSLMRACRKRTSRRTASVGRGSLEPDAEVHGKRVLGAESQRVEQARRPNAPVAAKKSAAGAPTCRDKNGADDATPVIASQQIDLLW